MKGNLWRVIGVAFALLSATALVVAAFVLQSGGNEVTPVVLVAPEATAPPAEAPREIRVHVSGAVIAPGVYTMAEGHRVMDVVAAAGGVRPNADLSSVNLALRVADEAHYHIPLRGETPSATDAPAPSSGGADGQSGNAAGTVIDLNNATALELETLPGIGPVMAGRIISHREANGPFASVEDVENVPGIGPKTLESIRPLVIVSAGQ